MFKYIIVFFLGYYILSRVFGKIVVVKKEEKKASYIVKDDLKTNNVEKKFSKTNGDYIDYEEVK
jgi:hypothetical protein